MKSILPYILVIAATFILSAIVVFGTLMVRPDLLKGSATMQPATDTVALAHAPKYLREYAGPTPEELVAAKKAEADSLTMYRDSIASLMTALTAEREKAQAVPVAEKIDSTTPQAATVDTAKEKLQKSRAKLLEAMPPEDAAKILANLSDEETKELLKYVKARQAAKIIASIQPERASKLFR